MSTPNTPRWLIAGHPSSQPEIVSGLLNLGEMAVLSLESATQIPDDFDDIDAVALVVSAKTGVSKEMIDFWNQISERQFPRMVIVNGLELSEIDFDDIVLIVNRVLESVITPFLVLHDELGEPTGLISLADFMVHDYSSGLPHNYRADVELQSLVKEFKEELELATTELDESAYSEGLLVPAIPLVNSKQIGKTEIQEFAKLLTKR